MLALIFGSDVDDWTTATLFSSGFLARASRNSSIHRLEPLGSWWECVNTNTSHQFFNHYTGSPSPPGLNTKSSSTHISASMAMSPFTLKNSSPHRFQHVPFTPKTLLVSSPIGRRPAPLGIEPFTLPPLGCGTTSLNIWGLHNWLMVLKGVLKHTSLKRLVMSNA